VIRAAFAAARVSRARVSRALVSGVVAVAVALAACASHAPRTPIRTPGAGVTIALYDRGEGGSYAVVDDRRWIEVTGTQLVLDHVDPGAALASLVIEPLGAARLAITRCVRERIPELPPKPQVPKPPAPRGRAGPAQRPTVPGAARFDATVRCTVAGAPGRHLVRVLYVSTTLTFRAQHDVVVTERAPTELRATVMSRFAIETPAWHERAEVVLFDGVPGGERPPREVARGTVTLDGSIAIISAPVRELAVRLRRIYDGAVATPELPPADAAWNQESAHAVRVWLELPAVHLAPGPVRVHVETAAEGVRDIDVTAPPSNGPDGRAQVAGGDAALRLPLWIDGTLVGTRQRFADAGDAQLAERLLLSVANTGEVAREVWIEEHVRPARRRTVRRAWPRKPRSSGDLVRSRVVVAPRAIERVGYTIEYDF
jgi:hypothetical protein